MDKLIDDNGLVAVLYSPGFGAGWYTWNRSHPECVFDPDIVNMVRTGAPAEDIENLARYKWSQDSDYFFPGGACDLTVAWLPAGKRFRIDEYDGSENLVTEDDQEWLTA